MRSALLWRVLTSVYARLGCDALDEAASTPRSRPAKRLSGETIGRARSMTGKLSTEFAERRRRLRGAETELDA